jgi:thiamine transporter
MEKTKTSTTIVECAILIAMAFALSFIKIIDMPYGGSVTAASMVPIIVAGYRHGLKWGLLTGFTYSILQLLMGLANVSYATSWVAAVAIILLDYVGAFTVLGLVGIFKKNKNQTPVLVIGAAVCFKIHLPRNYRLYCVGRSFNSNSRRNGIFISLQRSIYDT